MIWIAILFILVIRLDLFCPSRNTRFLQLTQPRKPCAHSTNHPSEQLEIKIPIFVASALLVLQ